MSEARAGAPTTTDDDTETARIRYSLQGGAAWVTLADGDRGNLVDQELATALLAAVQRAGRDSARVIVLRATGRFFSAGGSLSAFASVPDVETYVDDLAETLHRTITELVRSPAVVVSSVHGTCGGAGFPLAAAADLVVAGQSAKFTLGYTKIGLSPDGGTSLLTHTLGLHRALRLALLNEVITAEEGYQQGLVARVVPDDELAAATEALVAQLLAGSATAAAAAKRLLRETVEPAPERALRAETASIRALAASRDGVEGVRAFVEKRSARFGEPPA